MALAFGLALSGGAAGDTAMIGALKDSTIYSDPITSGPFAGEYGANGSGNFIFAGRTALTDTIVRRALVSFDIAGAVPGGSIINSVTLQLYCVQTISGDASVSLHRLLQNWGEGSSVGAGFGEGQPGDPTPGDATWQHTFYNSSSWTNLGGDFDALASATTMVGFAGSAYTWSSAQMAADVQSWLDAPGANFGWALVGDESMLASAKKFGAREYGEVDQRPLLIIDYTIPAPGTVAVLGALGLARRRRRPN
jgi:hypothetical protein